MPPVVLLLLCHFNKAGLWTGLIFLEMTTSMILPVGPHSPIYTIGPNVPGHLTITPI